MTLRGGNKTPAGRPRSRTRDPLREGLRAGRSGALFGGRRNRRRAQARASARDRSANGETTAFVPQAAKRRLVESMRSAREGDLPRRAASAVVWALKATILLMLLGLVAAAGYWGYRAAATSAYFTIRTIELEGVERAPKTDLTRLLSWTTGYSIFRLPAARAKAQLQAHPWIREVTISRQLPDTLRVEVVEQRPRVAVLLGHLYLVNDEGEIFKRASLDELEGLPVVTGIRRLDYLNQDVRLKRRIRRALSALRLYREKPRPPLSELHVGEAGVVTLFLRRGGSTIRVGHELTQEKLTRLDAVLAALGPEASRARAVYLDHEKQPNRVVVRMASYD